MAILDHHGPPPDAAEADAYGVDPDQSALDKRLSRQGTSVRSIIAATRAMLPAPRPTAWNEASRAEAELHAWFRGRKRIIDLPEVVR